MPADTSKLGVFMAKLMEAIENAATGQDVEVAVGDVAIVYELVFPERGTYKVTWASTDHRFHVTRGLLCAGMEVLDDDETTATRPAGDVGRCEDDEAE